MSSTETFGQFAHTQAQLHELADFALAHARELGATDCAVDISEECGLTVNVRRGEVETIEYIRDKGLDVSVYMGHGKGTRRGYAGTSDFSAKSLQETVAAAYHIARFTAEDDCAGLPDADRLDKAPRAFDLYHPWNLTVAGAISIGKRCEDAAFGVSPMVRNSEGASVSVQHGHFLLANSLGFAGGYPYSRHDISVAPIAAESARSRAPMQRDYWYASRRDAKLLPKPEDIGRYAAERALARLRARKLGTRTARVLFEAPVAAGLLGAFSQAASGHMLYRKSSFLVDCLGRKVFAAHVDIVDDPHIKQGVGSASFDDEGVRTERRALVKGGVLEGYFLSSYSARKLGMTTTGNSGGAHNLSIRSRKTKPGDNFRQMLKQLGTGLLVTELMGQGVNYVTGDYSRGASGFWVEKGTIAYPVEEITIAGNLADMFGQVEAVGADTLIQGNKETGSILIESMKVAGR